MKRDDLLDMNDALQHPGREIAVDLSTELPEEEDIDLLSPVEGYLEAVSTGNVLLVEGEFKTRCVLECSRCGHPLEQEIEYRMEEQFQVIGTPSTYSHDDYARVKDEEDYPLFEGNSLMVEKLVRQGLLVNLPMAVLCEHGWEEPCPHEQRRVQEGTAAAQNDQLQRLKSLLHDESEDAG
ncbi:MAG: DUF177 domain-containing protein [Chthonomonas sp.]|nr:DUF177 domain-containing protein [Chthonomonas sp.]